MSSRAGEPLLMDYITTFDMMNKSSVTINYEYRPEICILKPTVANYGWREYQATAGNIKANESTLLLGNKPVELNLIHMNMGYDSTNTQPKATTSAVDHHPMEVDHGWTSDWFNMHIEQAGVVRRGIGEISSAFLPPTLHVGGVPLDATVNMDNDNYTQPLVIMWEVMTEIDNKWNFAYTHATNDLARRECLTYWPKGDNFLSMGTDQFYQWGYRLVNREIP